MSNWAQIWYAATWGDLKNTKLSFLDLDSFRVRYSNFGEKMTQKWQKIDIFSKFFELKGLYLLNKNRYQKSEKKISLKLLQVSKYQIWANLFIYKKCYGHLVGPHFLKKWLSKIRLKNAQKIAFSFKSCLLQPIISEIKGP